MVHGLEKESKEKRWVDILDGTFGNTIQNVYKDLSAKGFLKNIISLIDLLRFKF